MEESKKIECCVHGLQDETFVCQHIVQSLQTGVPVGFHWPEDSDQVRPDAWCAKCEDARIKAGGDWNDELYEMLNIKLLCGACYDHAKSIWSHGGKITQ